MNESYVSRRSALGPCAALFLGLLWIPSIAVSPRAALAQSDEEMAPGLPPQSSDERVEILEPSQEQGREDDEADDERILSLEDRIDALETKLARAQEQEAARGPTISIEGHADLGAFWPFGDGSGFIQDFDHQQFPEYDQYSWVFLGDILATSVNSRGEAADLGTPPGTARFDSVDSGGAPGFIVNEVDMTLRVGIGSSASFVTNIDFVPRSGAEFALGDFVQVSLAQLEWVISESVPTSLFVGKIEPVFGIEYKDRLARDRFGVTPSLIARYTIGTPLGLKVRSKLASDWIILAASVTNGSSVQEQFHFYDEVDRNYGKTLTGRFAVSVPLHRVWSDSFSSPLEVGFSGQWGAQDRAVDSRGDLFLLGPDIEYNGVNFRLKGQLIIGEAPGRAEDGAFGLDLKLGGYVEMNYLVSGSFGLLARVGLRDAEVTLGNTRLYLTKSWRITVGARVRMGEHLVFKGEFLKNFEFGGIAPIKNDILTSSLLVVF